MSNNTLEDYHEVSSKRKKYDEEEHSCFKSTNEEDNIEVTCLTYD